MNKPITDTPEEDAAMLDHLENNDLAVQYVNRVTDTSKVRLGSLFEIRYGYIGGPVLYMAEHILIKWLSYQYPNAASQKELVKKLKSVNRERQLI